MADYDAVFFDLDGTLVDTATDMGGALNQLLRRRQRAPLSIETIRPYVSNGAKALIKQGFGQDLTEAGLAVLREEFLAVYQQNICEHSALFADMDTLLTAIENDNIPWGIVTNKPGRLTEPLLKQLDLWHRCRVIVSADTCAERKPHPMPMYYACKKAAVKPAKCVYIGDDLRDIWAGRSAGMTTIAAAYGYLGGGATLDIEKWGADMIASSVKELRTLIGYD